MKNFLTKLLMLLGVFLFLGAGSGYAYKWTIRGDNFGGWDNNNYYYEFEYNDNGEAQVYLPVLNGNFQLVRSDQNIWINLPSEHGLSYLDNLEIRTTDMNAYYVANRNTGVMVPLYDVTLYITFGGNKGDTCTKIWIAGSTTPSYSVNGADLLYGSTTKWSEASNGIISWNDVSLGQSNFYVKTWDSSRNLNRFYRVSDSNAALKTGEWSKIHPHNTDGNSTLRIDGSTNNSRYNIKFNYYTNEIFIEEIGNTKDLYLFRTDEKKGVENSWIFNSSTKFNNNNGTYTLNNFEVNAEVGYIYMAIADKASGSNWNDLGNKYLPASGNLTVENGSTSADYMINLYGRDSKSENIRTTQSNEGSFVLLNGVYNISFKPSDNQLKVELVEANYPKQVYILGHIKNKFWDDNNHAALLPVEGQEGLYRIDKVVIQGRWGAPDLDIKDTETERHINHSTIDENYVGFFLTDWRTSIKFGSLDKDNVRVYQSTGGVKMDSKGNIIEDNRVYPEDESVEKGSKYVKQGNSNNYRVGEGLYMVEANLNEMWVRFYRLTDDKNVELMDAEYEWYQGGSTDNNDGDLINHEKTQIVKLEDKVKFQVGAESDPGHPLALQAEYKVYMTSRKNSKKFISAGDVEGLPLAVEETHYTTHGSSTLDDNHLVEFLKPGSYIIAASIKADPQEVASYDTDNMPTAYLAVDVEGEDNSTVEIITVNTENDRFYEPFNPSGTLTISQGITFDKQLPSTEYVTVTLTPVDNGKWATGTDSDYAKELGDVPDATLYQQYLLLGSDNVDGFYPTGVTSFSGKLVNPTVDANNGYYSYDIQVEVPCSGAYAMEIKSKTSELTLTGGVNVSAISTQVYPNLYGVFGTSGEKVSLNNDEEATSQAEPGFNINGYTFNPTDTSYTITFPDKEDLSNCIGFIPGTYFASTLVTIAPATDNYDDDSMAYRTEQMDLTTFLGTENQVKVVVTKNGVTSPDFIFLIKKGDNFNVSTGIDSVESLEDGEVVYYNLQGVKVANPDKGIYVKVQNGKATKVIL